MTINMIEKLNKLAWTLQWDFICAFLREHTVQEIGSMSRIFYTYLDTNAYLCAEETIQRNESSWAFYFSTEEPKPRQMEE